MLAKVFQISIKILNLITRYSNALFYYQRRYTYQIADFHIKISEFSNWLLSVKHATIIALFLVKNIAETQQDTLTKLFLFLIIIYTYFICANEIYFKLTNSYEIFQFTKILLNFTTFFTFHSFFYFNLFSIFWIVNFCKYVNIVSVSSIYLFYSPKEFTINYYFVFSSTCSIDCLRFFFAIQNYFVFHCFSLYLFIYLFSQFLQVQLSVVNYRT